MKICHSNGYTVHDHLHVPLKKTHYWNCIECKETGLYNTTAESLTGFRKHCASMKHKKKKVKWDKQTRRHINREYGPGTADMLDELAEMGKDLVPEEDHAAHLKAHSRAERRKK